MSRYLSQPYRSPQRCNLLSSGVSNSDVEAIMTGETATFMGKRYARKQFTVTQRQQPTELIYRGICYAR